MSTPVTEVRISPSTGAVETIGTWKLGANNAVIIRNMDGDWSTDAEYTITVKAAAGYTGNPWVTVDAADIEICTDNARLLRCVIDLAQTAIYTAIADASQITAIMQLQDVSPREMYSCPVQMTICNTVFRAGDLPPLPPDFPDDFDTGDAAEFVKATAIGAITPADIGAAEAAKAYKPRVMVSFFADDGSAEDQTVFKPIMDAVSAPGCLAIIANDYRGWTASQLRDAQAAGWEISCHGYDHSYLTTMTDAEIEQQFVAALAQFRADGLTTKTLTYPYGAHNADVRRITRGYFSAGIAIAMADYHVNKPPLSQYSILRNKLDGVRTLESMQAQIQEALDAGDGWVCFYGHPAQWDAGKIADVTALVNWAAAQDLDIVTPSVALERIGNHFDSGDFYDPRYPYKTAGEWTIIGADGKLWGSAINREMDSYTASEFYSSVPITDYPSGVRSRKSFTSSQGITAGYGGAGLLIIDRTSSILSDGYQWQEWHPYDDQAYFRVRRWLSGGSWGSWSTYRGESASRTPYTITPVDIGGTLTATVDPANGPNQAVTAAANLTIAVASDSAAVQTAIMLDLEDGGYEITLDATGVDWDDAIAMPDPADGITTLILHSPRGATDWKGWQLATRAGS